MAPWLVCNSQFSKALAVADEAEWPTRERLPARARAVARDFGNLNNYYIKQVLPMILVTYNTTNTTNTTNKTSPMSHRHTLDRDPPPGSQMGFSFLTTVSGSKRDPFR